MVRLSVNVNKVALLRNSRGSNLPDLVQVSKDIETFGGQGITVHPRPDERHIHYADVPKLKAICTTEFNIEGNPIPKFMDLVMANKPHQVTLVPDDPNQLTSDAGWDTIKNHDFLTDVLAQFREAGIRTSIFIDPVEKMIEGAKRVGADRIEFYTGPYAHDYAKDREAAMAPYTRCAELCNDIGLGINAGHDLNLENLQFFNENCPGLAEVSIGHAIISDALYYGLSNVVQMYLRLLK